jgi:hypothetical protein
VPLFPPELRTAINVSQVTTPAKTTSGPGDFDSFQDGVDQKEEKQTDRQRQDRVHPFALQAAQGWKP